MSQDRYPVLCDLDSNEYNCSQELASGDSRLHKPIILLTCIGGHKFHENHIDRIADAAYSLAHEEPTDTAQRAVEEETRSWTFQRKIQLMLLAQKHWMPPKARNHPTGTATSSPPPTSSQPSPNWTSSCSSTPLYHHRTPPPAPFNSWKKWKRCTQHHRNGTPAGANSRTLSQTYLCPSDPHPHNHPE